MRYYYEVNVSPVTCFWSSIYKTYFCLLRDIYNWKETCVWRSCSSDGHPHLWPLTNTTEGTDESKHILINCSTLMTSVWCDARERFLKHGWVQSGSSGSPALGSSSMETQALISRRVTGAHTHTHTHTHNCTVLAHFLTWRTLAHCHCGMWMNTMMVYSIPQCNALDMIFKKWVIFEQLVSSSCSQWDFCVFVIRSGVNTSFILWIGNS